MDTGGISSLNTLSPAVSRERKAMEDQGVPAGQEEATLAQQGLPIPPGLGYLIQLQKNIESAGNMGQMPTTSVAQDLMNTSNQMAMNNMRPAQSPVMPQQQSAAMAPTQEDGMNQQGVASLPAPNIQMAKGGIVAFSGETNGSYVDSYANYKPFSMLDYEEDEDGAPAPKKRPPLGSSAAKPAAKSKPKSVPKPPSAPTEEEDLGKYIKAASPYIPERKDPTPPTYGSLEDAAKGIASLDARKGGVNDMNSEMAQLAKQFYENQKADKRSEMLQAAARGFMGGVGHGRTFWQGFGKGAQGALENRAEVRDKYQKMDKAYQDGEILRKQAMIAQAHGDNKEAARLFQESEKLKYDAQVNNNTAARQRDAALLSAATGMRNEAAADRRAARQDARNDQTTERLRYQVARDLMEADARGDTAEVERLTKLQTLVDPSLDYRRQGAVNSRSNAIRQAISSVIKPDDQMHKLLVRQYAAALNMPDGPEKTEKISRIMSQIKPKINAIKLSLSGQNITDAEIQAAVLGVGPAIDLADFG
jgi:hypothetical protein